MSTFARFRKAQSALSQIPGTTSAARTTLLGTATINQQVAADDIQEGGTWFEDPGTFNIIGNQFVIELSNFSLDLDPTHTLIIADAIRVARVGDLP